MTTFGHHPDNFPRRLFNAVVQEHREGHDDGNLKLQIHHAKQLALNKQHHDVTHVEAETDLPEVHRHRVGISPNRSCTEQTCNHHDHEERENHVEVILDAGCPEHQQDQWGHCDCDDSPEFGVRQVMAYLVCAVPGYEVDDALDGPSAIGKQLRLQVGRIECQTDQ
ncbi:hypothetical protein D3C75_724380 [compost metagenome]